MAHRSAVHLILNESKWQGLSLKIWLNYSIDSVIFLSVTSSFVSNTVWHHGSVFHVEALHFLLVICDTQRKVSGLFFFHPLQMSHTAHAIIQWKWKIGSKCWRCDVSYSYYEIHSRTVTNKSGLKHSLKNHKSRRTFPNRLSCTWHLMVLLIIPNFLPKVIWSDSIIHPCCWKYNFIENCTLC